MELWLIEAVVLHCRKLGRSNGHRAEFLSFQNLRALLDRLFVVHRCKRLTVNLQNRIIDSQSVLVGWRTHFDLRDVDTAPCRFVSLDAYAESVAIRIVFVLLWLRVFVIGFATVTGTRVMLLWCLLKGQVKICLCTLTSFQMYSSRW